MEWTAEKQKFDEQIAREIVQEKRFDILRKNFPTATEMTLYSNELGLSLSLSPQQRVGAFGAGRRRRFDGAFF